MTYTVTFSLSAYNYVIIEEVMPPNTYGRNFYVYLETGVLYMSELEVYVEVIETGKHSVHNLLT